MKALSFNDGWAWKHLDHNVDGSGPVDTSQLIKVTLPHDAMLGEPRSAEAPGGANTGWFQGRDYEYVKFFVPQPELANKALVLEFEGVYRNAEVWVNGSKVAFRPYGYTNFYVDITDLLNFGVKNEIRVVARNSDQPNSRWYSGAGIYRPVTLWVGEPVHILVNGVKVRTVSVNPTQVEIDVQTNGSGTVGIEIPGYPADSRQTDGLVTFTVGLPQAELWSPHSPVLHTCNVRFERDGKVDVASIQFGIRTIEWSEKGFLLNGKRTILQGACVHHDNGVLGASAYADAEERKVRLLQANGYNAIRSAHNPCSKALLDACDRLGMLVADEYIDNWYIHKTHFDYAENFADWWQQDLQDLVEKDYNHPSVIMYSIGNEVSETAQAAGIELTRDLTQHLHKLDPTRPVTCGVNIFFNFLSSIGMGVYSDQKANSEVKKAGAPAKKKAVGSEFFNNMAGLLGAGFMKRGATLYPCDLKTKGAFAEMDIAGYNYGILRYQHDLKKYPERLILGTETFCSDAYKFHELAKANPRLLGDFVWSGIDYLGEAGVGAWEYSDYAPQFSGFGWLTAGSGRLDLTGKPLGEAFYTRVALEQEAGPYIAVRPVNHTGDKHSPSAWKMSDSIDSWSWDGCNGRKAQIEVYARAAEVELLLNGHRVGRKKLVNDCIARFECPWHPGLLEAIAYDSGGKVIGRQALQSAKLGTELRAEPEQATIAPGHLGFVRLRYTDPEGIGRPLQRGILTVQVSGGELLGLGCASPFNPRGFTGTTTDTYFGEALAVVQADQNGSSLVELSAGDGTYQATATIRVGGS